MKTETSGESAAALVAASAASRATVRMVPSRGSSREPYSRSAPRRKPSAISGVVARSFWCHHLGESEEEMGQHHPGIAPGPEHGAAARRLGRGPERRVAERPEGVGDGSERQAEIGAGIPVGDREDIDAVDLLAAGCDPIGRREQGPCQSRPVDIPDPDRHCSAVTPPRPSGGAPPAPRGGAAPGSRARRSS